MEKLDIVGERFGKLTVLRYGGYVKYKKSKKAYWDCVCDCGKYVTLRGDVLRSGKRTDCGCSSRKIRDNEAYICDRPKIPIEDVPYVNIAIGIIEQAATDYRFLSRMGIEKTEDEDGEGFSKEEIEDFLKSEWCETLLKNSDCRFNGRQLLGILQEEDKRLRSWNKKK